MKKFLLFISSIVLMSILNAQEINNEERLVQFTGQVINEFLQPLKFAHVIDLSSGRGTITDREGKFSFVVHENDSVRFSSVGYKESIVVVPNNLEKPFFTRDVLMQSDTILITEIEIYPWKDYEDFKEAFLALELPEDDLERARKNIALIKTQLIMERDYSSKQNFDEVMKQQFQETTFRGTQPTYQIFNIFAWKKFFEAVKNGDFKEK